MKHIFLSAVLISVMGLTACSSSSPYRPGYGYGYDYDYDYSPEYKPHVHNGIVEDIFYLPEQYLGDVVTGTVLSHVVTEEIIAAQNGKISKITITHRPQVGYVQVIGIRLPGGDTLFSVQKNNSGFGVGQDVRILGTGGSHRVVDAE